MHGYLSIDLSQPQSDELRELRGWMLDAAGPGRLCTYVPRSFALGCRDAVFR
jgi:hypothetical protein